MQLLNQARSIKDWSVQHRRHLHQYPELSLKEKQTAKYCTDVLHNLGYKIKPIWGYGFIADFNANAKKTIALRADMDALPMQENNSHDFISKHDGVAHMCGHDSHMAIALTAARLLSENKKKLKCNVRFIFQPSEEMPPGGAIKMIEQGCLEDVDEVYGLHNDPGTEMGTIRTRVGPFLAAGDIFALTITGRGGHAARPQDCLDPIVVASTLITTWQALIARFINPAHPAVLSVTKLQAGETFNVIPDQVNMAGTVRTFYDPDRDFIENAMSDTFLPYKKLNYQFDLNYIRGYDAVINHSQSVQKIVAAANDIIGAENVEADTEPAGWAEDFCYYLQHRPGAFYILGSGNQQKGIIAPLHSSQFNIDENALCIGAAIMAQIVLRE